MFYFLAIHGRKKKKKNRFIKSNVLLCFEKYLRCAIDKWIDNSHTGNKSEGESTYNKARATDGVRKSGATAELCIVVPHVVPTSGLISDTNETGDMIDLKNK